MDLPAGWPANEKACIRCMEFSQDAGIPLDVLVKSNVVPPHIADALWKWAEEQKAKSL